MKELDISQRNHLDSLLVQIIKDNEVETHNLTRTVEVLQVLHGCGYNTSQYEEAINLLGYQKAFEATYIGGNYNGRV